MAGSRTKLPIDFEALRRAFYLLTSDYARALGESQQIQRFKAGATESPDDNSVFTSKSDLAMVGPFVRLLVGSHVRSRLDALSARFSQLEPMMATRSETQRRQWLSDHRKMMEQMASGLPSLRLPGLFVVAPFALTFFAAVGDLPVQIWAVVLGIVLVPSFMLVIAFVQAYRRKRQLFLLDAKKVDKEPPEVQAAHSGRNVYRAEEELFRILGSRRRPELELDELTVGLGSLLLAEVCFALPLLLGTNSEGFAWGALIAGFLILFASLALLLRKRRRLWR